MKRINLPLILDTAFTAVASFLLFFTIIRFYTKSAVIGLIFGIAAFALFGALAFLYISRKQNKSLLISRDEKHKKLLALHLSLSSDDYVKALMKKAIGEETKIRGKRMICGEKEYYFYFKMQPLSEDEVAQVIKRKTENEKIIYCTKTSVEAIMLAESFNIKITCFDEIYALLKSTDLLPEKYVYEGAQKISFFKKIKARFSRKLCAPLFWSGAALLALSYLTFYPVYYIISGGLMLILAAVALLIKA